MPPPDPARLRPEPIRRLASTARPRTRRALWLQRLATVLAIVQLGSGGVVVAIELALAHPASWMYHALRLADLVVIGIFGARVVVRALRRTASPREPWLLTALAIALVLGMWSLRLTAAVALVHDGLRGLRWLGRARGTDRILVSVGQHPARSLVLSFLGLIAFGSFLLSLPAAAAAGPVSFLDALFTAVSATCVTGLTVLDTATAWSVFGQGVILVLLQLGGIGIMAISAFMTIAVGRELGLKRDALLRGAFDEPDAEEMRTLVRGIVLWTLSIEAFGAVLLFTRFAGEESLGTAAAFSVFHAVSAFCNAGFALYSDSLSGFAADPVVSGVIAGLVVLGGFGFGVLVGIGRLVLAPRRARLTTHAKLVLVTSSLLVWGGALAYFLLEYDRSLAELGLGGKLVAALFQSVIARTAGFNTVDIASIGPATALVLMALMFVGASPGSTGGGIKTTTFAIVILSLRALIAERDDVEVFQRRVPHGQVMRALGLAGGGALTLLVGFAVLLMTERIDFLPLAFEATSAFGTVGLSMGATPELSPAGRLVVSALMFTGRVGPLTVLAATAVGHEQGRLTLPEARVLVG